MATQSQPYDFSKAKSTGPLTYTFPLQNVGTGMVGYGGLQTYGTNPNAGGSIFTPTPVMAADKLPTTGSVAGVTQTPYNYANAKSVNTNPIVNTPAPVGTPSQPSSQGSPLGEVDQVYQSALDAANQAESALAGQKQSAMDAAMAQYLAGQQGLAGQKQSALGTINENATQAQKRKEDAAAAARRMYSELQTGFNQRFGRASSAGEAAMTLGNLEQQRQQGAISQDYGTAMRQIEAQKIDLENNYQTQLRQLDANLATAKNDIISQFNQQLNAINQARTQTAQEKANARLQVLQQLRNSMSQLSSQKDIFVQQLNDAKAQTDAQLAQYGQQSYGNAYNSANAANNFISNTTTNPQSSLRINSQSYGSAVPTGAIRSYGGKNVDAYGNPVY